MRYILLNIVLICLTIIYIVAQKKYQTTVFKNDRVLDENFVSNTKEIDNKDYRYKEINNQTDTKVYGYWDYQSNGGSINYIDINPFEPENVHIVYMTSTDSTDAVSVSMSRRVFYNFSNDAGAFWGIPRMVPNFRAGYPSLKIAIDQAENNICVIASHSLIDGYLRSALYIDNYAGSGNFSTYLAPLYPSGYDNAVFPVITQTSNGNILLAASFPASSTLGGIAVITFNLSDRTWGNWVQLETSPKHSGRLTVASGNDGYAAVIWRASTNPDSLIYRETTNNGLTWGPKIVIDFETATQIPCWTGFDALYNGTDLYIVFTRTEKNISGNLLANEVCFWKSSTRSITTVIDSNYYPYLMKSIGSANIQTNHSFAFNFPSIGLNMNKTRIYVGVDVFLQNETDLEGFNYSDILISYSDDFGVNWSIPRNITRTNNLDERYVSLSQLSPNINDSNYVYILYQEDKIPGANFATNAQEARPVSGVKLKFLKFNTENVDRGSSLINVNSHWNMISIPLDTTINKSLLFPSSISNAFTISDGGAYIIQNNLVPGRGYWLKFRNSEDFLITGKKPHALKIPVKAGWNMLGCFSEEIAVDKITTTPPNIIISKFYAYSNGYIIVNSLKPGKGYWVKVKSDGYINLISK